MKKNLLFKSLSFLALVSSASAQLPPAEVVRLDEIAEVEVTVTPESRICRIREHSFWREIPCPADLSRVQVGSEKTASAKLKLNDGREFALGESTVKAFGTQEEVDYRSPLSNLPKELAVLKNDSNVIYFNQYNLCYRIGVSTEGLQEDRRSGGDYYHLKTARIFVNCDASAVPAMVYRAD